MKRATRDGPPSSKRPASSKRDRDRSKRLDGQSKWPSGERIKTDSIAIREVMGRVGDRWTVHIVASLGGGPLRFTELRRHIAGISQRMLTLTLKNLERDGILTRTTFKTSPPRVDYELSKLGATLLDPVLNLTRWAESHWPEIQAARERHDASSRSV